MLSLACRYDRHEDCGITWRRICECGCHARREASEMADDTFMMDFAALEELRRLVNKYGNSVALSMWQLAEAQAIRDGQDHISFEGMSAAEAEYLADWLKR